MRPAQASAERYGASRALRATLSAWAGIFRMTLRERMQYRIVLLSRITVNAFWGAVHATIMLVYFTLGTGASQEMTAAQAVSYIWIGQILFNLQPGQYDGAVWEKIRSGDIGVELLRPLSLYGHWFMRSMAVRVAPFLIAIVPITLVGLAMPGGIALSGPASLAGLMGCVILTAGALVLGVAVQCFQYAMMSSHLWGPDVTNISTLIVQILSGAYLPLALWPDALQPFLRLQPFAGMWDLPLRAYLGMGDAAGIAGIAGALAIQLLWSAVIIAAGWLILRRSLRSIVIQGG